MTVTNNALDTVAPASGLGSDDGQARNYQDPLENLLASGSTTSAADSLAIPVTHRYVAKTTGADAEALTLANGVPGQTITISLVVKGASGTGTLTPATKSGFVNVVLDDAGDNVTLYYVDDTVGWVIVGAAGVSAPPVIAIT